MSDELRALPHNLDAELSVLGAILLDARTPNAALAIALQHVSAGDFFLGSHQKIWRRMVAMADACQPVDLVTLTDELSRAGELEAAGGPAYVAKLMDGVPRVTNVAHYAKIVRAKSILRNLAHAGQQITQAALERDATVESIAAWLRELSNVTPARQMAALRAVSAREFLATELAPREMLLAPILSTQSLAMLYSKRGVGKTFMSLGIAVAVAAGDSFLQWEAPKPRKVLFVDGELPGPTLQERLASITGPATDGLEMLRVVTPDLQSGPIPDLATQNGQNQIEALLEDTSLLILDNLSALCRIGKENESESWLPVQQWALRLRQKGVSVLFVHHAGKGGAQRGTSRREDQLDVVLALRHPHDYLPSEGLRCEVYFEKCRCLMGEDARPFEVRLEKGPSGEVVWTTRSVEDAIGARAAELFGEGLSVRDVSEELAISKSKAHRLKARLEAAKHAE